jgi:hypothetical protein
MLGPLTESTNTRAGGVELRRGAMTALEGHSAHGPTSTARLYLVVGLST